VQQPDLSARRARPRARDDAGPRFAAIACLAGIALTHALDLGHKWDEAPYVGVLFVLAIAAAGVLALLLLSPRPPKLVWAAAGALAGGLMAGYFASRTVGLPNLASHVGHWRDAAGSASLVFESMLIGLSLARVRAIAWRLAPAAVFLGFGVVGGAAIAGEVGGHHGHAGHGQGAHSHGDGRADEAGHAHGAAGAGAGHTPGHVGD
jgi:hypothetical protein